MNPGMITSTTLFPINPELKMSQQQSLVMVCGMVTKKKVHPQLARTNLFIQATHSTFS
jgi:hypothetical protein